MAANTSFNDSDDLEDLDYGDDDFDFESRTEQSQNSGARTSTQEADREDGEDDLDEDEDDQEDEEDEDKDDERTDYEKLAHQQLNDDLDQSRQEFKNRRGQKRKHEDEEEENCDQSRSDDKTNAERCKFWPYCTAGDKCSFYHPSKPCRTFPNCRFGSNCLYIHPPCKFLPNCTRVDCPFAHPVKQTSAMRRIIGGMPLPMASHYRPQVTAPQPIVPKCKFGFKCSNLMCKFSHQATEPCRYGANCLLENCAFSHPTDQQQSAHQQKKSASVFKWTAKS